MSVLLRSATIISPESTFHLQQKDLLIQDGIIRKIGENLDAVEGVPELTNPDLHVSAGWMDSFADFCDPGFEYREDLASGTAAAAAGGFTQVCLIPSTEPVLHSKSEIEYVRKKTAGGIVTVHPFGAVSRSLAGIELTEMYDMRQAGAIAFCEGVQPLWHTGLMLRALRYVKPFEGVIINLPRERELGGKTGVHEGLISTRMGMPGIPALAETLTVQRDLSLARYTKSKLHFAMLSCADSVELVRQAKADGIKVTAGVAAYQLLLNDEAVSAFDPLYKVTPPLRSEADRLALIAGVQDGTIDLVCSNHIPQHEDAKKVEFEYADKGINGLETTYAALNSSMADQLDISGMVKLLTEGPRNVFDLENPVIKEGAQAELTFFSPSGASIADGKAMKSRARNNPLTTHDLKGAVLGIANQGQVLLND